MSVNPLARSETFNARFLNFQEVGASFVTPPFLEEIAAPNNTAILGPRGSGKTTLLKMLTLPALLSWKDPKRDELSARIDYLAIYIPSSLTWNADYRGFSGSSLDEDVSHLISVSLFRHNVLFALLGAWRDAASSELGDHTALLHPLYRPAGSGVGEGPFASLGTGVAYIERRRHTARNLVPF
jgi:hypothetical protein